MDLAESFIIVLVGCVCVRVIFFSMLLLSFSTDRAIGNGSLCRGNHFRAHFPDGLWMGEREVVTRGRITIFLLFLLPSLVRGVLLFFLKENKMKFRSISGDLCGCFVWFGYKHMKVGVLKVFFGIGCFFPLFQEPF